jgi:MraZ protein
MEFLGTLDDKYRISLPSRVRGSLSENKLILTKGENKSIWMFTPEKWEAFYKKLVKDSSALPLPRKLRLERQFIAPKAEMEIDKAGRIAIPQSLRDYAHLSRDITILEVVDQMEIWDSGEYADYLKDSEAQLQEILEDMGPVTSFGGNPG